MKKIVALVLALALALSLCTVAFAERGHKFSYSTTTVKSEGYSLLATDTNAKTAIKDDEFEKYVFGTVTVTEDDETTTYYKADLYVIDGNDYYACASACAEFKLVKSGKVVAWLTDNNVFGGDCSLKGEPKLVEADDGCGDYTEDVYELDGDVYYKEGETLVLTAKGMMAIGEEIEDLDAVIVPHDWNDEKINAEKGVVTAIYCDNCKKYIPVVKAGKIAADDANKYSQVADTEYYYLASVATKTATTATAVDSSKTFDAGVAMYVGLSLMSVAGSAVVIGKKKEF